jgi:hypothetical protein
MAIFGVAAPLKHRPQLLPPLRQKRFRKAEATPTSLAPVKILGSAPP